MHFGKLLAILSVSSAAICLPSQTDLLSGAAQFQACDDSLSLIVSENKAVLEWNAFSIQQNEAVHFSLPNSEAMVLNRVTGPNASEILGRLSSNGQVWISNSSGIYFGKQAVIDTAHFAAICFDVLESEFLNGNSLHLQGLSGPFANEGRISVPNGSILIAAQSIEMEGNLEGKKIAAAAGPEIFFTFSDSPELIYSLDPKIAAEHSFIHSIHWGGDTSLQDQGAILLYSESKLNTSGTITGTGIQADFFAPSIVLENNSHFECPESHFRVGGSRGGADASIPHADWAWFQPGATANISGSGNRDGGSFVLWGTKGVSFEGAITGRSGPDGGTGAFVEVSTKGGFRSVGSADLLGFDSAGTLVWDPIDVTISTASTTGGVAIGNPTTFPSVSTANINVTDLANILLTANVTINALSGGSGGAGSIEVQNNLSFNGSSKLTLSGTSISVDTGVEMHALEAGTFEFDCTTFEANSGSAILAGSSATSLGIKINASQILLGTYLQAVNTSTFLLGPVSLIDNTTVFGNVLFDNTIDGAYSLDLTSPVMEFMGNVGGSIPPTDISLTALYITNFAAINCSGTLTINNVGTTTEMAGVFSADAGIDVNGPLLLDGAFSLTTSTGDITFTQVVDSNYGSDMTLSAPSGSVTFQDDVGIGSPLYSVTVNAGNTCTIDADMTAEVIISVTAPTVVVTGLLTSTSPQ